MNKRIVILGGGESGVGAALLAIKENYDVFVTDANKISDMYKEQLKVNNILFEDGGHTKEIILNADIIVKSPGVPEKSVIVQSIRQKGITILSEIEFAYQYKGNSKIIAVTGSNGKSTTTSLVYHILKTAGLSCALVGNIGNSFAKQVAEDPKQVYAIEVSSFQLDDIITFCPDIAILTNITEDHLDRYDYSYEKYIASKFKILKNQTNKNVFIYCIDDATTVKYLEKYLNKTNPLPYTMNKSLPQGAYIIDSKMHLKWKNEEITMSIEDFAVKGKHNQYNTMAAALSGVVMDIRKEKIREAVQTFESLEHRMEKVSTIKGVEFINDSKATNINSTWFALESMTKPTILILGGIDKGNDYSLIMDLVRQKVKAIVCLGLDNNKIHEAFGKEIKNMTNTTSIEEAIKAAFHFAEKGDVVLLSPACASFDLFKNYEDRGDQYKQAVKNL